MSKKKPIILSSTKTKTTIKTTQHICLSEDEAADMNLNRLQSILEDEPKKRILKHKHAKRRTKNNLLKIQSQQWTESDTETEINDGFKDTQITRNGNENVDTLNVTTNDIRKNDSESASEVSLLIAQPRNKSKKEIYPKRDIDDIIKESLLETIDAGVGVDPSENCSLTVPIPLRKLSAIFETSAETNGNVTKFSSPSFIEDPPIVGKTVSKQKSQEMLSFEHEIPSQKVFATKRITRIFDSTLSKKSNDVDDDNNQNFTTSKKRKSKNKKVKESLPLIMNEEISIQNTRNDAAPLPTVDESIVPQYFGINAKESSIVLNDSNHLESAISPRQSKNKNSYKEDELMLDQSSLAEPVLVSNPIKRAVPVASKTANKQDDKSVTVARTGPFSSKAKPALKPVAAKKPSLSWDQSKQNESFALPEAPGRSRSKKSARCVSKSVGMSEACSHPAEMEITSKNTSTINVAKENNPSRRKKNIDKSTKFTTVNPAKPSANKRKPKAHAGSRPTPSNESLLCTANTQHGEKTGNARVRMNQSMNKSKQIIIYSPSRDKLLVKYIGDDKAIIPKSMIAEAIGNPNSGVLKGMTGNSMVIDANERLIYSPREGEDINVKEEIKKGTDILNVLSKRRKSVFIFQHQC